MGEDVQGGEKSQFNQAAYLMRRIDEIESRLDRMNTNPFGEEPEFGGLKNYQVMLSDLQSLLSAISPKLTSEEIKEVRELIKKTAIISFSIPFMTFGKNSQPQFKNMYVLTEAILDCRLKIESFIDKKGIGNPNKLNPNKAVIN